MISCRIIKMYHTSSVYRQFLSLLRDCKPLWNQTHSSWSESWIQYEVIHFKSAGCKAHRSHVRGDSEHTCAYKHTHTHLDAHLYISQHTVVLHKRWNPGGCLQSRVCVCACVCQRCPADWKGEARHCSELFITDSPSQSYVNNSVINPRDGWKEWKHEGERMRDKRELPDTVLTWVLAADSERGMKRKEKDTDRSQWSIQAHTRPALQPLIPKKKIQPIQKAGKTSRQERSSGRSRAWASEGV